MTADEPILLRRLLFLALCLVLGGAVLALAVATFAPGGWTAWEALILLCLLGTLPWNLLSMGNALVGFAILMGARDPPGAVLPALRRAKPGLPESLTAIAVCVRNEDMAAVLAPLRRLSEGLEAAGAGGRFVLWILSDTQDPTLAAAEEAAVAAFAAAHGPAAPPLRYRRRTANTGFKAANVMDFLDHHAGDAAFLICLDADSEMSAAAVLRLVACMEADPKLAILQQLITGRPARAAFPRLFQFGMRAGMRTWATGQAWWQGDEGPYWGHNAILRIAPFRAHCRLETLPDGRPILSHDQVEATRLHAAGWKVRVLAEEDGSQEGNPPAMPEFLTRDLRWAAGNMQYWALLRLPGLTPMARWQLVQAILLFLGAPLWLGVLLFGSLNALTGGGAATPAGALAALMLATWFGYFAAKLMGYLEVLLKPALAARYGGRALFAKGAAAELLFTQLFEPARLVNQALFLAALPFGLRMGWAPQNRADRGVAWADAARLLWPHTLLGLILTLALAFGAPGALPWALPFLASLLLAIPVAVATASPGLARRLYAGRINSIPEELWRG